MSDWLIILIVGAMAAAGFVYSHSQRASRNRLTKPLDDRLFSTPDELHDHDGQRRPDISADGRAQLPAADQRNHDTEVI